MKIKLKDAKIKGWQKKKKELPRHTSYGIGDEDYESGITIGFNRALNLIGNLEFNPADYLDENVMEKVIQKELDFYVDMECPSAKQIIQAIVDSKDVVKAKEVLK